MSGAVPAAKRRRVAKKPKPTESKSEFVELLKSLAKEPFLRDLHRAFVAENREVPYEDFALFFKFNMEHRLPGDIDSHFRPKGVIFCSKYRQPLAEKKH